MTDKPDSSPGSDSAMNSNEIPINIRLIDSGVAKQETLIEFGALMADVVEQLICLNVQIRKQNEQSETTKEAEPQAPAIIVPEPVNSNLLPQCSGKENLMESNKIMMRTAGIESIMFSLLIALKMSGLNLGSPLFGRPIVHSGEEVAIATTLEAILPLVFWGLVHDLVQRFFLNSLDRTVGLTPGERKIDIITSFLPITVAALMLGFNVAIGSVVVFESWWINWLWGCVIVVAFAVIEDVLPTWRIHFR